MSEKKSKLGSLLEKDATGGEIAEHGFSFQEGMLLARLPAWLAQSGFSQVIREALGDTEANFFVPGRGSCREFNEYKDHRLTPSEFWPEIDRFLELERAHAGVYRSYRLVCVDVNDALRALCRALDRARRALPFYDGVSSIRDVTFDELAERVMDGSERDHAYAEFVFKKVEIDFEAPRSLDLALASFRDSLERYLPESGALNGTQVRAVRDALGVLIASRVAEPISRSELVEALRSAVPEVEFPTLDRTRLLTTSKQASPWEERPELVLDWERFSGGGKRAFPGAEEWRDGLEELTQTRDWIRSIGAPRTIRLEGTRRLSASVALGSTFSATGGFVIEVENRGELLRTDQHAGPETPPYEWNAEEGEGERADEIAVVLSVKRTIADDVRSFLAGSRPVELVLHSSDAMLSADQMNLAVERTKERISSVISKTGASVVHLFLAVPSPFALFLGHRLNATCSIQCYEHTGGAYYAPTFFILCT